MATSNVHFEACTFCNLSFGKWTFCNLMFCIRTLCNWTFCGSTDRKVKVLKVNVERTYLYSSRLCTEVEGNSETVSGSGSRPGISMETWPPRGRRGEDGLSSELEAQNYTPDYNMGFDLFDLCIYEI